MRLGEIGKLEDHLEDIGFEITTDNTDALNYGTKIFAKEYKDGSTVHISIDCQPAPGKHPL